MTPKTLTISTLYGGAAGIVSALTPDSHDGAPAPDLGPGF